VLNAIVADQLNTFRHEVDLLNQTNPDTKANIVAVLQGYQQAVKRIVFNGNGYSKEWEEEAAKRGLSNNKNTPSALKALATAAAKSLFERLNIFSPRELESRCEVLLENYINKVDIEAKLFLELGHTFVLPAACKTIVRLGEVFNHLKNMGLEDSAKNLIQENVSTLSYLSEKVTKDLLGLKKELAEARAKHHATEAAETYANQVKPYFEKIRTNVDLLEELVDNEHWSLPKYRELLFIR
jgi:glutamine synthetase